MFDDVLIESAGRDKIRGRGVTAIIAVAIHLIVIGAVVAAGYWVKHNPQVIPTPIRAFMVSAPPPPPPPPPGGSGTAPRAHVETPKPHPAFHQPTQISKEVPEVETTESTPQTSSGVTGGQPGGVAGGVVGGVAGGVVGGTLGGVIGGQIGGAGTALHVGGDVLPPETTYRVQPEYTELARKARVEGIVIIEAIIDQNGNVTDARILKGLPLGLNETALQAVKQWKFKPGTLHGEPVPVIFNLTINYRLQ